MALREPSRDELKELNESLAVDGNGHLWYPEPATEPCDATFHTLLERSEELRILRQSRRTQVERFLLESACLPPNGITAVR